jgi:hypothetical protein
VEDLLEADEPVGASAVIEVLAKMKFALEEVLRRDTLATRRWNALVGELNAKKAELKVYKEAVDAPHSVLAGGSYGKGESRRLRMRLHEEIGEGSRLSAAEVVVSALEKAEEEVAELRKDNLKLRAKVAAMKERGEGGVAGDGEVEADADGRVEEVVMLRYAVAGLFGDKQAVDSPARQDHAPQYVQAIEALVPRSTSPPSAAFASGAATPELRGTFWGDRQIEDDFALEMLNDSQVPHTEEDESSRVN